MYKLARPYLHVYVNITAHNPSKIGIFVSEYTFSEELIKSIFRNFNQTKDIFMNLMAASLQKGRPNIFRCQYKLTMHL